VDNTPVNFYYLGIKVLSFAWYALIAALVVLAIILLVNLIKMLPDIKTALKIYIKEHSDRNN